MAQACRFGNNNFGSKKEEIILEEKPSFVNIFCIFVSLISLLADLTTDTVLFAEYCKRNDFYWAIGSIMFLIIPSISIHIFSMRWFLIDMKTDIRHWFIHLVLLGVFYRYITFLRKAFKYTLSKEPIAEKTLSVQRNDLILLHFLYVSIGTVPQIILQSYSVIILSGNYYTRVISLAVSMSSLLWAFMMYIMSEENRQEFRWVSFSLKIFWHFGMLIARIAGILIFTVIFGIWTLVPMGIHWAAMTFWIITQKTTFCPNKLEETFYNVVMGFIYCFCYINLCGGHTRYRLMVFYTLMVTQNFGSLFLFILISDLREQKKLWSIMATVSIVAGTVIGIFSMLLYYRWFHAKGPITWKNDVELNNKVYVQKNELQNDVIVNLQHTRSFKSLQKAQTIKDERGNSKVSENMSKCNIENADKKFLLDHWIARSGTPTFVSAPVGSNSMEVSSIEFHTVENTPQSMNFTKLDDSDINCHTVGKHMSKHKKLTICPPTELNIKLSALQNLESSIDELTSKSLNLQKRRGICSSDVLRDALESDINNRDFNKVLKNDHDSEMSHETDGSNKKTSSDSIDMDLDLSFSDINSSDINTFNENIVQKLCLSALKNIKVGNQDADIENIQRIALDILKEMYVKKGKNRKCDTNILTTKREVDTPTEMLSVHDYENICAVNIAREAWGLRSWNGYCDIENWLHDDSVVRERRCDTFTSGSSEISSSTSQEIKNYVLSGLQGPLKKMPYYSNVCMKQDETNQQNDYVNTTERHSGDENIGSIKEIDTESELIFPISYVVDNVNSHLEPIMEELDDLGDMDPPTKKRLNSESSLVATIDEIRKATVTNSPKCVYHRREHLWDSPQLDTTCKLESNLKHALWKEPSKFDSSNIMKSLPEKENVLNDVQKTKFDENKKENNILIADPNCRLTQTVNSSTRNKNTSLLQKPNLLKNQVKKVNNKSENAIQVLSDKNARHMHQLVFENLAAPQKSVEDLTTNQINSSLQSLIVKDNAPIPLVNVVAVAKNISNYKRVGKNKPRRKFSLLREKFEPKINKAPDEEVLYQHSTENINADQKLQYSKIKKTENDINNEKFTVNSISKHSDTSQPETHFNIKTSVPGPTASVKENQSPVMKQFLSPPNCNVKLKYKI